METTNNKIIFRKCMMEDIPSVMEINERTLPENYPLFFYEQILERYGDAFFLASLEENPKKIIGYIMWRIERGPSSFGLDFIKKGHLVSLAVLDEYRRQGAAKSLINNTMAIVRNQYDVSECVLEVRISNSAAVKLYAEKHQYERIRILSHYYRDGEDAFYMSFKFDGKGNYKHGSTGMTDDEIIKYYHDRNQSYLCYRCPNCSSLFLKELKYSFPGSINPNNPVEKNCVSCGNKMNIYDISQGKYDVNIDT